MARKGGKMGGERGGIGVMRSSKMLRLNIGFFFRIIIVLLTCTKLRHIMSCHVT
jgi:hypothetical protein